MLKECAVTCACLVSLLCAAPPARGFDGVDIPQIRALAEQGDAVAQSKLGVMYASGLGMKLDKQEAFRWYGKSAEQGYPVGQWNLAFMYVRGEGTARDFAKARELFRSSAQSGFANAQYDLGMMLLDGLGGPPDRDEAEQWFRRAADQGYREAKKILQELAAEKPSKG
jgi:TPR repeat protein